ncbi:MAG: hypothetical protein ACYDHY_17495 [Acidiferrobacterales bacterium]
MNRNVTISLPKPLLLAAEALAAGAGAAGLDAVQAHLLTAAALPSPQVLAGWFAVGAIGWTVANLRKTYAGLLSAGAAQTQVTASPTGGDVLPPR